MARKSPTDGRKSRQARALLPYALMRYWRDEALDLASSLAYTSLLAMVPIVAVALVQLAAFPEFESIRRTLLDQMFHNFVPEVGQQVQAYVARFAANAGRLTVLGLAGLVATSVMLLVTIEAAFNRIFRVPQIRAPLARLVVYWAALSLGPLLAGAALTMREWISVLPWVRHMHLWAGWGATRGLRLALDAVTPGVVLLIVLTTLFLIAPNRRVRFGDALGGAAAATVLILLLRWGFGLYIAYWGTYRPIYGAVATVPIFLAWIYLSWTAVLFGAEIAASLPELRRGRMDFGAAIPGRRRIALALAVLAALERGRSDAAGVRIEEISRRAGEGEQAVAEALRRLVAAGLAERLRRNRYRAAGDLAGVTLGDLVRQLDLGAGALATELTSGTDPAAERLRLLLARAAEAEALALRVSLRELVAAAAD